MRVKKVTDHPFDKVEFSMLVTKAMGERSQVEFCKECGLSYAHMNRYVNGKNEEAPTLSTIKKIVLATELVSYAELLHAAGYDPEKYINDVPQKADRKDLLHPVCLGIANAGVDFRVESKGYKDGEPFEIVIEKEGISKWFFVPVTKKDVNKDDILNCILNCSKFIPGSKVSFVTDSDDIFENIKDAEFPLLSISVSVVKVKGSKVIEEVKVKTSQDANITVANEDRIRPFELK